MLTVLNSMAGKDFVQALDTQKQWGISLLDLKNNIYGKSITELSEREAEEAMEQIARRQMSVYCFSTELFYDDIEQGEAFFRARCLENIENTVAAARILKPKVIRLLAARSDKRNDFEDIMEHIHRYHSWLIPMYREAVEAFYGAGFQVTIENECHACIFSKPAEIIQFFQELNCPGKVSFTYDVQNLWQMGTFPTMEVYRELAPLIGYFHVKGGQSDGIGTGLKWKTSLEDASWPVVEMTQQAVDDGLSPVICLNSSHGALKDGYDYHGLTKRDLDFLRSRIRGLE